MTADEIVAALAKCNEPETASKLWQQPTQGVPMCALCRGEELPYTTKSSVEYSGPDIVHTPDCPWLAARAYVEGK